MVFSIPRAFDCSKLVRSNTCLLEELQVGRIPSGRNVYNHDDGGRRNDVSADSVE